VPSPVRCHVPVQGRRSSSRRPPRDAHETALVTPDLIRGPAAVPNSGDGCGNEPRMPASRCLAAARHFMAANRVRFDLLQTNFVRMPWSDLRPFQTIAARNQTACKRLKVGAEVPGRRIHFWATRIAFCSAELGDGRTVRFKTKRIGFCL
jgi:hypothetical protein